MCSSWLGNHRIIERSGLEVTLKIIWFQPPCHEQGHLHQTRLLRAPTNLALNTSREGADTASLGNLGQCFTTLMVKNFFLLSNLNLPSFSLQPFLLVLSLHTLVKSPSSTVPNPQRSPGKGCHRLTSYPLSCSNLLDSCTATAANTRQSTA